MPTHRKDPELGLPGVAAALVVVFIFPILFFVARQKWRISKARKEEIGRLVVYASEEAHRAEDEHLKLYTTELEIAGGFSFCDDDVAVGGGGDGVPRLCAMCYSPTTTRCSRCKSVRYCSGKCQIIHWRKGHKDECRPPVNIQSRTYNGLKSKPAAEKPETKLPGEALGEFVTKPAEEFKKDDAMSDPFFMPCISLIDKSIKVRSPVGSSPKTLDADPTSANDVPFHSTKLDIQSRGIATTGSSSNFSDGCGDLFQVKDGKKATSPHLDSKPFFSFNDTFPSRSSSLIKLSDSDDNDEFFLKPKTSKSPHNVSPTTSVHVSRRNHVSSCTPLTLHPQIKPLGNADFSSNGGHAHKSSVQRVEQLKSSKTSKLYKVLPSYDAYLKLYSDKGELQPYGLINCGNSCYANAVLQCLTFTRPLTAYFLQRLHSNSCPKRDWCFTCEVESLVVTAKQGKSPLSPIRILSQIHNLGSSLGHGKEEDAHEFLRCAIDAMQQDCIRERGKQINVHSDETTLMQQIFGGYLRSMIRCLRCQGTSQRDEVMMDLTVEIGPGDNKTLEQALARFTTHEILDGENKYKCNRCKSYQKARKRLTIFVAPNVLTIALKRFQSGKYGKLNKTVQFPEFLNMTDYMSSGSPDKSPLYCLYAVIVHVDIMNAAFSGHYVCYVKNTQGKWYKVDDSTVKPVELERVLSEGAYMLLYARISPYTPKLIKYPESECVTYQKNAANFRHSPDHHTVDSMGSFYVNSHSGRFSPRYGFYKPDASSESSSMSFSDESSVSTESTRDSSSTDEYHSDYFFAEKWYSPSRLSEESDGSPLPDFLGNSQSSSNLRSLGNRNSCFLYSETTTKHGRKLAEQFSSSCSGNMSRYS